MNREPRLKQLATISILLIIYSCTYARAQSRSDEDALDSIGNGHRLALRTNMLYDLLLVPNLGIEYQHSPLWSLLADCSFNWMKNDRHHRYWRVLIGEVELRRWLMPQPANTYLGHHLGAYTAFYRYDLEWGGTGWQADFNYGFGVSYGYAFRLGDHWSLDLCIGMGYLGGKYKKYEPDEGDYIWKADVTRHYFGPTKLEAGLVWQIPDKKGGRQ